MKKKFHCALCRFQGSTAMSTLIHYRNCHGSAELPTAVKLALAKESPAATARGKEKKHHHILICEVLETAGGLIHCWFSKNNDAEIDTWVVALRDRCNAFLKATKT